MPETLRECKKCGVEKPLVQENFPKQRSDSDILRYECRACFRLRHRRWKDAQGEEYRKESSRQSNAKRKPKPWTPPKNREAVRARRAAYYRLVERGERPTTCQLCWDACTPEAHHEDHSKPLEVIWLCKSCHGLTRRISRTAP